MKALRRRILVPGVLALATWASAAPPDLCGRLSDEHGIRVLELWGSPAEAGFAHGYLLAEDLMGMFDATLLDPAVGVPPQAYEAIIRPAVARTFRWEPGFEAELEGLLRGLVARLGAERVRSARLDRPLTVDDLKVANTLADWRGVACSSFSAWGPLTADGQTLTARNLDYPSTPAMRRAQLVVIRRGDGTARAWIGVCWPGLIGVYTGMNDAGVTIAMHDAEGLPTRQILNLTPRSLALRLALEAAGPRSWPDDVARIFRQHHVIVGNNIHVSAPCTTAAGDKPPPAGIFEYDGNPQEDGVTLRLPETAGGPALETVLICTNHMRKRQPPRECGRYATLARALGRLDESQRLDVSDALKIIHEVARDNTLHSVVFMPARRAMLVHIPAVAKEPVLFELDGWLRRSTEHAP